MSYRREMQTSSMDIADGPLLSVVIPALDEAESLPSLHGEVVEACLSYLEEVGSPLDSYEVILVDDGSSDGTREACESLEPLRYIRHEQTLGQSAALERGFREARGTYVVSLDGDGQNDPADIPALLGHLVEHGLDCVCGWRVHRNDPLGKRVASRGAYILRQAIVRDGIHDSGCTLKAFRRECLEGLPLEDGQHRFIPALLKRRGYSVGEVPVNHRPRLHGRSKYGPSRMAKGLRDLIAIGATPTGSTS